MFILTIDTNHTAFDNKNKSLEMAKVLDHISDQLRQGSDFSTLRAIVDNFDNEIGNVILTKD